MHATRRPHARVGLLAVTVVAVAVVLVSAAEVDYTYTCPGSPPVTVQVADLPCGCLAERKQLTKVLGCAQSDQFNTVLDACRTCAKRSDCNCSAPAEVEDQSSGGESDADEEKRAFRETVNNDFPWLPAIGVAVAAVALCAGCLCIRDKWRKMEEVDDNIPPSAQRRRERRRKKREEQSKNAKLVRVKSQPHGSSWLASGHLDSLDDGGSVIDLKQAVSVAPPHG